MTLNRTLNYFKSFQKNSYFCITDNYDAQIVIDGINTKEDVFHKNQVSIDTSSENFLELFIECLLYKSQISLLHFKKLIKMFKLFLKDKLADEKNQIKTLETIYKVWQNNEHKIVNLFDQLLTLGMIHPNVMIKFVFEVIKANAFTKNMYWKEWTILKNILSRKNMNSQADVQEQGDNDEDMGDELHEVTRIEPDLDMLSDCFAITLAYIEEQGSQEDLAPAADEATPAFGLLKTNLADVRIPAKKRAENVRNREI